MDEPTVHECLTGDCGCDGGTCPRIERIEREALTLTRILEYQRPIDELAIKRFMRDLEQGVWEARDA